MKTNLLEDTLQKYYNKAVADYILGMNEHLYGNVISKGRKITWWDRVVWKWRAWGENISLAWEALRGKHYCEYD